MLGHETEDQHAIGHPHGVRVTEIELVLAVAPFMVEGVDVPTQLVDVLHHGVQERVRLDRRLQVVSSGGQVQGVVGDEGFQPAVDLAHDIELRLDPHHGFKAHGPGGFHDAPEHRPGIVAVGLVVKVEVSRRDGETPVPGQHGQRRQVGKSDAFILVGAERPHALQGAHGIKLGAFHKIAEMLHGYTLRFRHAMDIHVGAVKILGARRQELLPCLFQA